MGVGGHFWEILKPYCRFEGFDYLRNKRVAVDLSFWIVQHETATGSGVRNPHLRLTFLRTINLFSKFGALPVFVVDGVPSPLKSEARIKRFYSGVGRSGDPAPNEGVSWERNGAFQTCVEECVELLKYLGMPVLTAKGEADALCAQLNNEGLVDACVTSDSDAFLYGANCVIKSIRPKSKDPFECYHMSDIRDGLGLKRSHLIAVSVLVGNDHDLSGVQGIGVETAVRFVKGFHEDEVLNRLDDIGSGAALLQSGSNLLDERLAPNSEKLLQKMRTAHCSLCGHPGNKIAHRKVPCQFCRTSTGEGCSKKPAGFKCSCASCAVDSREKEKKRKENWHFQVCSKIASSFTCRKTEIIRIYLNGTSENDVSASSLSWKGPQIDLLVVFLAYHQHWEPSYIKQRLFPMMSTIFLRDMAGNPTPTLLYGQYEFDSIQRIKVRYGHQFYVVKWKKPGCYIGDKSSLLEDTLSQHEEYFFKPPEDVVQSDASENMLDDPDALQIHVADGCSFVLTDENIALVQDAFPEKVEIFSRIKGAKGSKTKFCSNSSCVGSASPNSEGRQSTVKEFFRSIKSKGHQKPVDDIASTSGNLGSGSKRSKDSSPNFSKSVRRRLLLG